MYIYLYRPNNFDQIFNISFVSSKLYIFSKAFILFKISPTASLSLLSHLRLVSGPCNILLIIPLDNSSTALTYFLLRSGPSFDIHFVNSFSLISSAFPRNALMVGTVSKESLQVSKVACSSYSIYWASKAADRRSSQFMLTTSIKSSTLCTILFWTSFILEDMFLGTAISMIRRGMELSGSFIFSASSLPSITVSELDAAKTMSEFSTHSINSSMRCMSIAISGKSAYSYWALGQERFKIVALVHPLESRCLTRSVDIFPAPIIHTRAFSNVLLGSFSLASSTAAELTDTLPLAIDVSVRTRFPATIAYLNSPFRCLPNAQQLCPSRYTFFTWDKIWPSPITKLSKPALTCRRCSTASASRNKNRKGRSSSIDSWDVCASHSSISRTPRWQDKATTQSSKRLQVDKIAASSI